MEKLQLLPWAVIFPNGGNISRHPSQIYEAILEGILLIYFNKFFSFKKKIII